MFSTPFVRSVLLVAVVGLACPMSLRAADAEEAASPLPPKVQPENAPITIENLFQDYVEAREEVQRLGTERDAEQSHMSDLEQQIRQIQLQYTAEVRPLRSELTRSRATLAACKRALTEREPRRPVKGLDVNAGNRVVQQRYNRKLAAYRRRQNYARKEMSGLAQRITELEIQLATLDAQLPSDQTPLLEELRVLRNRQNNLTQKFSTAMSRTRTLADALRRVPEDQRLQRGICEWENTFYSMDELRRILDDLNAACDRDRSELEAKVEADGRTLPKSWRHPQQDKLDALKARIERAGKETAAVQ